MTQVSQGHGDLPRDVHGDLLQVVPNFTGTRRPALGRPRFHRDVRTWGSSPGCPQCCRGHGDLPWDVGWLLTMGTAALWRSAPPPWLLGSSSQCTQGCSQGHYWGGAEQREKRQRQGEGSGSQVPSLGTAASFPAATASGTSMLMLLNYSAPAWHGAAGSRHPPRRAGGDGAVPSACSSTGQTCALGTHGHGMQSPHVESAGLPCSGCSVPQFPHTALDTSVSGEG